jgi:hypothetical protein
VQSSPLAYRVPNVPAKIPLGMTEREYWQVTELEEEEEERGGHADVRLRGLNDDNGWTEMRNALPNYDSRRRDTG